jgi:hypothetical protein
MNKYITISKNVASSQSKNCWLFIQLGTTAIHFWRWWRMDNTDTAWRLDFGSHA